jgi:hypothetical protein
MKPVKDALKKDKTVYKVKDLVLAAIITGVLVYWSHM